MVRFRLRTKVIGLFLGCFIVLLSLCSYGIADGLVIEHGRRDCREIAITFDACPTALPDEYDEKVIDVLLREKMPATLFLSGRWVEKNPDKVKFLAAQPQFEIANHAFWHPHLLEKDDDRILRELK